LTVVAPDFKGVPMKHMQRRQQKQILFAGLLCLSLAIRQGTANAGSVPPANDACDNATSTSRFFEDSQDTSGATMAAADPIPTCGNSSRGKSVWYQFTAPESGPLVVDTLDSTYDTILSVYTGPCDALVALPDGCNDDDPNDGAQSKVTLQAESGTNYLFMVTAFDNDGGSLMFSLNLFRAPSTPTPTSTITATSTVTATVTQSPGPLGDANCDQRVTAADLTALVLLIGLDERATCRRDDSNGDDILDNVDIEFATDAIFASAV
jgi:hypothetical protein